METLLAEIAERCIQADASTAPKYRRLMNVIGDAINSGVLAPGDRLPTEQDFAAAVPYALGTVQKALNGLVAQGLLYRNRRSGTFVAENARPLDDTSQFDFKRAGGGPTGKVVTEITDISLTHDTGHWVEVLGDCAEGYVKIKRMDRMGSDFSCYVEIHLRADRFSKLLTAQYDSISGKNIRSVLETRFGIPVAKLEIASGADYVPAHAAEELGIRNDVTAHLIDIAGFDASGKALYTQATFVPPGNYRLVFEKQIN